MSCACKVFFSNVITRITKLVLARFGETRASWRVLIQMILNERSKRRGALPSLLCQPSCSSSLAVCDLAAFAIKFAFLALFLILLYQNPDCARRFHSSKMMDSKNPPPSIHNVRRFLDCLERETFPKTSGMAPWACGDLVSVVACLSMPSVLKKPHQEHGLQAVACRSKSKGTDMQA
jgi:hypothetical protein